MPRIKSELVLGKRTGPYLEGPVRFIKLCVYPDKLTMPRSRPRRSANSKPQQMVPVAKALKPGRMVKYPAVPFTGTERLGSLQPTSADGFITTWNWNPGLSKTFSVGHFQAGNFDKYTMRGSGNRIRYEPACSTLTTGTVCILIDYDPNDNAPINLDEFTDNELAVTGPLYSGFAAPVEKKQMDNCKMLIRTGPTPTDLLLTDPCAIHVAAFGYGADSVGQVLGHFFIDYAADLHVRQPISTSPPAPRNFYVSSIVGGNIPAGTTQLVPGTTKYNTLGAEVSATNIRLPSGSYRADLRTGVAITASSALVFLSFELHINGIRVDQSPAVYSDTPATNAQFTLHSNNVITVSDSDIVEAVIVHDADSFVIVEADRSLLSFQLV